MPKGYWIVNVDVHDMEGYKEYVAANGAVFGRFGARFLVRSGRHEVVEGQMNPRIVVLEFKDYDTARACYFSPEYQELIRMRLPHGAANLAIVEGWDG